MRGSTSGSRAVEERYSGRFVYPSSGMKSTLLLLVSLLLLLGCGWVQEAEAMGPHYYDMIEDMIAGVNYYDQLEIKEDATAEEVRKSFRKMALK